MRVIATDWHSTSLPGTCQALKVAPVWLLLAKETESAALRVTSEQKREGAGLSRLPSLDMVNMKVTQGAGSVTPAQPSCQTHNCEQSPVAASEDGSPSPPQLPCQARNCEWSLRLELSHCSTTTTPVLIIDK